MIAAAPTIDRDTAWPFMYLFVAFSELCYHKQRAQAKANLGESLDK